MPCFKEIEGLRGFLLRFCFCGQSLWVLMPFITNGYIAVALKMPLLLFFWTCLYLFCIRAIILIVSITFFCFYWRKKKLCSAIWRKVGKYIYIVMWLISTEASSCCSKSLYIADHLHRFNLNLVVSPEKFVEATTVSCYMRTNYLGLGCLITRQHVC